MKKVISIAMVAVLLVCTALLGACGTEKQVENAVYVTVANGDLVLTYHAVSLSDADGDGATTVNDALLLAHDAAYEGGASAGYASAETEYGLSLTCLWGDASGAYGYRVNDASAMSLRDAVAVGDHVYAYVYTDQATWSDAYSYFDVTATQVAGGEEITLTLSAAAYDEAWNPISVPVEGAIVTVDGKAIDELTDADGKVTLTLDGKGEHVISATTDAMTLVPPVCVVTVK